MSGTEAMQVAIIDYGAGNLHSLERAFTKQGAQVRIAETPAALEGASAVVLPGVGAFGPAMARLRRTGLAEALVDWINDDGPVLAICLGMQLLASHSEEGERAAAAGEAGLAVVPGSVVRLQPERDGYKVPHVGWNEVRSDAGAAFYYFTHSYAMAPDDPTRVTSESAYGAHKFPAMLRVRNLLGVQFHPEMSGEAGARLIAEFVASLRTDEAPS